jgi:lipopolysaccharide/colanic/teichoic acid biosynthesis glycosyltransferase
VRTGPEIQPDGVALPAAVPSRAPMITAIACRVLDIVLAIALLVLLLPLLGLIALAVRLDSPGPALFRQRRCGLGLREFKVNKFRTMYRGISSAPHREYVVGLIRNGGASASPGSDAIFKLQTDERITRVGRILRRFSLDELPQLWNVVTGEMSLVGPRPAIPYEVEHYPSEWCRRFIVKPGLTGLWQVSGRNQLGFAQMVELDLDYARRRSFLLNLRIIVKTVWVVAHGRGAA